VTTRQPCDEVVAFDVLNGDPVYCGSAHARKTGSHWRCVEQWPRLVS
jgi:hypothetical protein